MFNRPLWEKLINVNAMPGGIAGELFFMIYFMVMVFLVCAMIEWIRIHVFQLLAQIPPFRQIGERLTIFCSKVDKAINDTFEK